MFLIKLVGKIFKWTLILSLTLLLIPVVFLGFMYRNEVPNIADYDDNNTMNLNETLASSLDEFLLSTNQDTITFQLNEKAINQTVKDYFIKASETNDKFNKDYLNQNVSEDDRKYAYTQNDGMFIGVKGAWIKFSEKEMTIITSADIKPVSFFTYKTSIKIVLSIESNQEEVTLKIKSMNIGNLPSVWIYNMAKWGMLQFGQTDIEKMIEEQVKIGDFDSETRTFTLKKTEYTQLLESSLNTSENELTKSLLELVTALDLFNFGVKDDSIDFSLSLGKLKQTLNIDDSKYPKLESKEALDNAIMTQLNSTLISALHNIDDPSLNLDINEIQLNQIINYYLGDKVVFSKKIEIGSKEFTIETKPLVTILKDELATISIRIAIKNEEGNEFISELVINTKPKISEDGKDLAFEIKDIKVGETNFPVGNEVRTSLLKTVETLITGSDDVVFESETIILKDFMNEFLNSGTKVSDVTVLDGILRFKLEPQNDEVKEIVKEIKKEIKNVLKTVSDEYDIDPDTKTPEEIMDYINELTEEQQKDIYEKITTELDNYADIDLSQILSLINQN